jgi:hypothetical protein
MTELLIGLALFLLMLAFLGAMADSIDARDARRRNHVSRRR